MYSFALKLLQGPRLPWTARGSEGPGPRAPATQLWECRSSEQPPCIGVRDMILLFFCFAYNNDTRNQWCAHWVANSFNCLQSLTGSAPPWGTWQGAEPLSACKHAALTRGLWSWRQQDQWHGCHLPGPCWLQPGDVCWLCTWSQLGVIVPDTCLTTTTTALAPWNFAFAFKPDDLTKWVE